MEDADAPLTQPYGSLVPPVKVPGTALAVATPPPPRNFGNRRGIIRRSVLERLVARTLDSVDELADAVAAGLGLRPR